MFGFGSLNDMDDLKPDRLISWGILCSAVFTITGIAIAPKSPVKSVSIPVSATVASTFAIWAYRRNQPNKNVELYLKFAQELQDNKFADSLTTEEIISQKSQEIELTAKLAKLEEIRLDTQARLAEFD